MVGGLKLTTFLNPTEYLTIGNGWIIPKFKALKARLKQWNSNIFGSVDKKLDAIIQELFKLKTIEHNRPLTPAK